MSDVPGLSAGAGEQRELLARLRAVIEVKDAENAVLRAGLDAALERYRRLELRVAELERRLGQDSTDSGTPASRESIGAKERRRAGRRQRQESERERRQDRKRGGQPGHRGKGLAREPDPGEMKDAGPSAECRSCRAPLDGAAAAGPRWAQVIGVDVIRKVTEWLLPGRKCPCCGTVTFAEPPPGAHAGSVSYGAVLNAAAVVLTAYGIVPPETTPATRWAAGCCDYKEQVFLFTRDFAVDWTTNVAERGAKAAKRHQAVCGYWHSLATPARCCGHLCAAIGRLAEAVAVWAVSVAHVRWGDT